MANFAPPNQQQKPKLQTPKQHAQQAARQILQEPIEILKSAGKQVVGGEYTNQGEAQAPGGQQVGQRELEEKRRKETARVQSHTQAFQQELAEIRQLQEQGEREKIELRMREEQEKKQKEQQKREQNPLIEPVAKVKRGILGAAGAALGIKRKQRSTELAKTPSN